jgi:hypothetical protein
VCGGLLFSLFGHRLPPYVPCAPLCVRATLHHLPPRLWWLSITECDVNTFTAVPGQGNTACTACAAGTSTGGLVGQTLSSACTSTLRCTRLQGGGTDRPWVACVQNAPRASLVRRARPAPVRVHPVIVPSMAKRLRLSLVGVVHRRLPSKHVRRPRRIDWQLVLYQLPARLRHQQHGPAHRQHQLQYSYVHETCDR